MPVNINRLAALSQGQERVMTNKTPRSATHDENENGDEAVHFIVGPPKMLRPLSGNSSNVGDVGSEEVRSLCEVTVHFGAGLRACASLLETLLLLCRHCRFHRTGCGGWTRCCSSPGVPPSK